jgi:hypothetical protein
MENKKTVSLSTLKAKPILATFGQIEVYNINSKQNADRRKELFDYIVKVLEKTKEGEPFESNGTDLLLNLLPILTNVLLEGMSEEEIQEIIEEPSDELLDVIKEVNKILVGALDELNTLMTLPKEQLEKIQPKKSKKELLLEQWEAEEKERKAKLEAQLAELDNNNVVEVDFEEEGE